MKKGTCFLFSIFSLLFVGCNSNANANAIFKTSQFDNVNVCDDVYSFINASSHNRATDYGVIVSPYFSLKINDVDIPVYACRTANGIHSFAYIFATSKDGKNPFNLNVSLKALEDCDVIESKETTVDVLPLRHNVKASLDFSKKMISATISDYGNYSFVFGGNYIQPITLLVSPLDDEKEMFENKDVEYLLPGDYSTKIDAFNFTKQGKVYYFKKGYYKANTINIPNNSIVYFEPGAYVQILPGGIGDNSKGLHSTGTENIKILGHGLIDYSQTLGGEGVTHDKTGNIFESVNNLEIKGLTIVNSNTWTLCCYNCDDVHIQDVTLLSYRVFADGIMLSGCKNGLVERNFVRTGDDGFEVKAAGAKRVCDNILFQYNDAWTDKADAYGCIYETVEDIRNVSFQHNSVGFAIGNWSEHLGCICVQLGDNVVDPKTISNIKFNDMEVYCNYNPSIISFYYGGFNGHYKGYGHMKDIYISNINVRTNKSIINTYVSFINHLPEQGGDVSKIGTFENIVLSNIQSNGITLSMLNQNTPGYVNTKFYSGDGYSQPELNDFLFIRNGNTYE